MRRKKRLTESEKRQRRNADEAFLIRISDVLRRFRASKDKVYTFEANLSNHERALVHQESKKMGMKSKSSGTGNQRRVSIYKKIKNEGKKVAKEGLTNFTFSEESKMALEDLFVNYPPEDEDCGDKTVGKVGEKAHKKWGHKDDFFRKPSMNKSEISEKVDLLASRVEKDANLRQILENRSKLPIGPFKDVITSTIESHQVVLISGETGCGKTTQVPQFVLDHMWGKGEACKIVCTQPRRISATSVAERISFERGQEIGDDIGYKIRLESKGGRHSSVVFCTNGVLLRVLVSKGISSSRRKASRKLTDKDISCITHIIVDEIHERDCYADFMIAIFRDMLPSYPHLRLILMSATLDAERFSQYFGGCQIIRVPGFTYPVKSFYLEDVLSILKSANDNHLHSAMQSDSNVGHDLSEEDREALDEAINLAWLSDEFDPLLDFVSSEGSHNVYNYQHSFSGLTPLMVFAGKGRVGDVCLLLSFGADCHLLDKCGRTAMELAEQENQLETAEIIRRHVESARSDSMKQQQLLDKYLATIDPQLIDVVLIEQLIKKICVDSEDGAILVFLPGWDDINRTRERLLANPFFRVPSKFLIISLHSMVPSVEQKKVFKRPPEGCRKIILSTNIAETAVTIDDVMYVIDSGRMKEKSYDPYDNVSTLQSTWVSKASAKQREGRAGRCQPGICYHLYSKLRADSLPDFQVPEIRRMPIEELCLQVKFIEPNCSIDSFLRKTLDPPVSESIRNAVLVLQDIGALSPDEKLTEFGEKLGCLPIHPVTSKMLFFSILVNCLDPALTLACASDYRDPFTLPLLPNDKKKATAAKLELTSLYGGHSDQLAVVAAYECWKKAKEIGQEAWFCSKYFVSSSTMNMLHAMRNQLQAELIHNGYIPEDIPSCSVNASDPGILHAVLVAGLYPMVGRLLPPKNGNRSVVEIASGAKVRLHPHSLNFKVAMDKTNLYPLIIYDEVTRGEMTMHVKNCTIVGPLPLLLLAREIAVAPAKDGNGSVDDDEDTDGEDAADVYETNEGGWVANENFGGRHGDKIMSSPDNAVNVVVDRWLCFESTALDVAQLYCLRERLSSAILLKVTKPRKDLPPALAASLHATASILSYDGLSSISLPAEPVDAPTAMFKATETNYSSPGRRGMFQYASGSLISLMSQGAEQVSPSPSHKARIPASREKS